VTAATAGRPPTAAPATERYDRDALGVGALAALCAVYALLAVLPASEGSDLVLATDPPPAGAGESPGWLLGPLRLLGAAGADGPLAGPLFYAGLWVALILYSVVLTRTPGISRRLAIGAVVGLHGLFLLAPPLLSQDVFSYIAYARLGVEHDLNPYTHEPHDIPGDEVFGYTGSKGAESVYGPLFTLLTYPLVPLGVPGAFWALKLLMAAASLGVVWLVWRSAERLGRDPLLAAMFVGLNPLVLCHVVAGAHNEALVMLVTMAGVYAFIAGRERLGAATATAAAGIKASAGLVVPFLAFGAGRGDGGRRGSREGEEAGRRPRAVVGAIAAAGAAAAGIALVAVIGFGTDALDALGLLSSNQERTSRWSFPYKTAQALGAVLPGDRFDYRDAVRTAYALAFAALCAHLLWRTWRGADPVRMAGWATLAILVASAWLVPWYALWLLPLAALAGDPRLLVASIALCAWMLPIAVPL
jgi:alpha-1,6-mannosyltransferase